MNAQRSIDARDVPDEIVEMVADAVRLCRRADQTTRETDVIRTLAEMNPGRSAQEVVQSSGYAARLLS